jgi:Domain of unknown function (DUF6456)
MAGHKAQTERDHTVNRDSDRRDAAVDGVALRHALHLLSGAPQEARAARRIADAPYLTVSSKKQAVTLALGTISLAMADHLIAEGLAQWETVPSGARFTLTVQGRALAREPDKSLRADAITLEDRETDHGPARVIVDRRESPLAWLARRKGADGKPLIDPACFAAGERLRADFERTGLQHRVTMDWGRFGSGASSGRGTGGSSLTDAMIAARQRMDHALADVGADLSGVLLDICCFLKGLDHVERERGWPPRSAKLVLTLALARLARHYGLMAEVKGPDFSRGIVTWSAEPVAGV